MWLSTAPVSPWGWNSWQLKTCWEVNNLYHQAMNAWKYNREKEQIDEDKYWDEAHIWESCFWDMD